MNMIEKFSEYGDTWWYIQFAVFMFGCCTLSALLFDRLTRWLQRPDLRSTAISTAIGATVLGTAIYGDNWLTNENRSLVLFEDGLCYYDKDHSARFVNWRQIAKLEQITPKNRKNPEQHTFIEITPDACTNQNCVLMFHVPVKVPVLPSLQREFQRARERGGAVRRLICPSFDNIR